MFDVIAVEIDENELIEHGHLVPPVVYGARSQIDLSRVGKRRVTEDGVRRSEFDEAAQDALIQETLDAIADELVERGEGRLRWIAMLPRVASARMLATALNARGVPTAVVVGETEGREAILDRFRDPEGDLRAVASVNVLAEGFDAPIVDLVALVRATTSPVLYKQAVGRGLRPFEGKVDCLILDYGGNAARHGPIDAIVLRPPGDGEPPARECPQCGMVVPIAERACPGFGFEFPPPGPRGSPRVKTSSDDVAVLRGRTGTAGQGELYDVASAAVKAIVSRVGRRWLVVDYTLVAVNGARPPRAPEWLDPAAGPRSRHGRRWASFARHVGSHAASIDEALAEARARVWRRPARLRVAPDPERPGRFIVTERHP